MYDKINIYCDEKGDAFRLLDHFREIGMECQVPGKRKNFDFMSPDIVALGSNILITLINAVVIMLKSSSNRKIVIKSVSGWMVEIPANCSKEELENYIDLASTEEVNHIAILKQGQGHRAG